MNRNKAIIIGAGVAGLSAGCHLQSSGYETEIYEAHTLPGGLCTAWRRGAFLFDGCIHWLPGITRASFLHDVNDEVLDLAGMKFAHYDTVASVETFHSADPDGNRMFHLYGNIERLDQYLRHIAPDDGQVIDDMIRICRYLASCRIPPTLDPSELVTFLGKLAMVRHAPLLRRLASFAKYTMQGFAERAKSPFLKEALQRFTFGKDYPAVAQLMQVAFAHQGSSGTPLGGSLELARRIERRYLSLGGRIAYKSRVRKIIERDGRACGIELDEAAPDAKGPIRTADLVISAADGHWTLFEALGGRHLTPFLSELYAGKELEPFESLVYVSLGLGSSFEGHPTNAFYSFPEPRTLCDGSKHTYIQAHLVNFDPALAPPGKSILNVMLLTRQYDFWNDLRAGDEARYSAEKEKTLQFVVDALGEKMKGIEAALEVWDVATPATFRRYTGNWRGSYEGWYPAKNFLTQKPLPKRVPSLKSFYMIGQWTEAGGGITPCIKTGRDVARLICREDGRRWVPPKRS